MCSMSASAQAPSLGRRVLGDGHGGHVHPPKIFNLGKCNCNVCKYALNTAAFKKGCKQIAENCRGGLPSAPVHPPSWGAEHAPVGALQAHCRHLPLSCKRLFYRCYILPLLDYSDTAWSGITTTVLNKLETHNRMLPKILFSKDRRFPSASLYKIAKISPLSTRHKYHLCVLIHKILLNKIRYLKKG